MKEINIGLLGLGTVGSGTLNVLTRNAEEITRRTGLAIKVTHAAARDPNKPHLDLTGIKLTNDAFDVVNDPEIDIIVELIGGCETAKSLCLQAIENGKHIVSANKALIAEHGNELFQSAAEQRTMFAYEAAVAGGIPIIKALREGLAANKIKCVAGIINGTGNYILTQMRDNQRDFNDALKEAQELGYAEADPTFDIEGIDAAHKLTILASIAYGVPLRFAKTFVEGISSITLQDIAYANELGYRIKHLGISKKTEAGIEMRVHPALIPKRCLLANVNGVMNSVLVSADAAGPTLYYGPGAGSDATASAVVADIIDVARVLGCEPSAMIGHFGYKPSALIDIPVLGIEDITSAYYLRMQALDKPGVMAKVTSIFGKAGISIEAIVQKEPIAGETELPIFMLTHKVKEHEINAVINKLEKLDAIHGSISRIRVEYLPA